MRDDQPKPARKTGYRIRLALVGILIVVPLLLIIFRVDVEGILFYSDRLAVFPAIEADYRRYYDAALGASQEVWLKAPQDHDNPLGLLRGRFYRGCIRGGFSRTYGTDKPFAEIRAHYLLRLSELGWRDSGQYPGVLDARSSLWLYEVSPASPDFEIGHGKYQTIFRLALTYADPAINRCSG